MRHNPVATSVLPALEVVPCIIKLFAGILSAKRRVALVSFIVLLSVLIDHLIGEPSRFHPLVGFGELAKTVENHFFAKAGDKPDPAKLRLLGIFAVCAAILPCLCVAAIISSLPIIGVVFTILILYLSIGARSLEQHARAVAAALANGDLEAARRSVAHIVSRDCSHMNATDIIRATIESVLENGSDAIFGALFWFVLLGAPGAVLYRLSNTLDAMWGYRNERYLHFGWAAAKLDDLLNFVPARLTAFSYMIAGNWAHAYHCWRHQSKLWYSPNAGPVMATGAGALCVKLGGPARYHGQMKERPWLGTGEEPEIADISRAVELVQKVLLGWVALITIGSLLIHA